MLDSTTKRVGLRTLRTIPQTKDAPLHFEVNGVPFFAKGANWIPADSFANRVTRPILPPLRRGRRGANMNSLASGAAATTRTTRSSTCATRWASASGWITSSACSAIPSFDERLHRQRAAGSPRKRQAPAAPPLDRRLVRQQRGHGLPRRGEVDEAEDERGRLLQALPRHPGEPVRTLGRSRTTLPARPTAATCISGRLARRQAVRDYRKIHGFVSEFGFQSFPEPKTVRAFTEAATASRSIRA